ncbi:MAG: hypothetical protein ACXWCX_19790 [Burkholderiales bacterium]
MTTADTRARASRKQTVVTWVLAVSTIIGALLVEAYAFMQVMGTAGCSDRICPHDGPGEFLFGTITYGAPVVALAAIIVSVVAARRPRGWLVPAIAWALLVVAFLILAVTFRG